MSFNFHTNVKFSATYSHTQLQRVIVYKAAFDF